MRTVPGKELTLSITTTTTSTTTIITTASYTGEHIFPGDVCSCPMTGHNSVASFQDCQEEEEA